MQTRGIGWIRVCQGVAVACVLCALAGCHRTPAEQAIRETIAAMQKAGEAHDVSAVIDPLSEDFIGSSDEGENLDRKGLERYLRFMQLRETSIHASLGPITVKLQGADRATAEFTAVFTGGDGLLPDDGRIEHINTGWRLDGSKWKLISADWKASGSK
ncbi:MAG: nuclear transport factor 2 family protein [Lysobacteraceae bacterium]